MTQLNIADKYLLTVPEAAAYYNISQTRLRQVAHEHMNDGFIVTNGNRLLFNKKKFNSFIDDLTSI